MGNPLLTFWYRIFGDAARSPDGPPPPPPGATSQATATIFVVLRRMRAPFIVLIVIFAVSVLGLMVIPGKDSAGRPAQLGLLDAFYFMSYTATTIGFGEIPHPFTALQRSWVTVAIFLSVVGWAYAIGSLLGLLQDHDFRQAVSTQRFARKVARLREPFLLVVGHGQTGRLVGDSLDALGRRFVVVDRSARSISSLDRDAYHFDVPGLAAEPSNPEVLVAAGLRHPRCEGVLALTDDDDVNLAVTTAAGLVRPRGTLIARAFSVRAAGRMRAHGATVINPFDAFGDHLRLAVRSPASYQLEQWLTSLPGEAVPPRRAPLAPGRWVVAGYGRFGQEVTRDLRSSGVEVTVVDAGTTTSDDPTVLRCEGLEADMVAAADVAGAAGIIAADDDDVTNLALVAAARRDNPDVFVVARQNDRSDRELFEAADADLVLVPHEVTAHEVLALLGSPVLLRFLKEIPRRGDAWAEELLERLVLRCGHSSLMIWQVDLAGPAAAGLRPWLLAGHARITDLLRSPADREAAVAAVPLMVVREGRDLCTPGEDLLLAPGDSLLLAGLPRARRELESTFVDEATREYVLHGRDVPSSWIWRRLARQPSGVG
ncbi:NAD-binding protein [Georgenia sp. EYE_87]|uniref:NAD-binding protein n=1 Tax=Georgenia sp. EYE_87 TaxID=2853448 RepID=UPI002002C013|nr:NAD-binding protein [Georgenia sp. EYE_87]MCK6211828.1 NAD-binding protein [Georgenia sp. EYE_87]